MRPAADTKARWDCLSIPEGEEIATKRHKRHKNFCDFCAFLRLFPSSRLQSKTIRAVTKDLRFPRGAERILRMRSRRGDAACQVKENRGRMFVCGHGRAECNVAEMLQRVGGRV